MLSDYGVTVEENPQIDVIHSTNARKLPNGFEDNSKLSTLVVVGTSQRTIQGTVH